MKSCVRIFAQGGLALVCAGSVQAQGGAPPFAGGGARVTIAEAMKLAPKADPALVPYYKKYQATQTTYVKNPKNGAAKKAYVEAAYAYGHATMLDQGKMPPPVQYRAALGFLNKALAADPKHAPSLKDKNQIESIYKSMGMPVPK